MDSISSPAILRKPFFNNTEFSAFLRAHGLNINIKVRYVTHKAAQLAQNCYISTQDIFF